MIEGLLWILGCYGLGMIMVHFVHFLVQWDINKVTHYVLITKNSQNQLEWYVRVLLFFSWVKGKQIKISIVDVASTDDTMAIAHRLTSNLHISIHCVQTVQETAQFTISPRNEEITIIRLIPPEDVEQHPLFQ